MNNSLLGVEMLIAVNNLKDLLEQIKKIEDDVQTPTIEKLSKIKNIKEEISKVSVEIDSIKERSTLLITHNVN
jgi:hypothetical protein